jgi:hypothetical protein
MRNCRCADDSGNLWPEGRTRMLQSSPSLANWSVSSGPSDGWARPWHGRTPTCLRDLHTSNRRRFVTEVGNFPRPVDSRVYKGCQPTSNRTPRSSAHRLQQRPVGLDLLVGLRHFALGNIKRFGMPRQIPGVPFERYAADMQGSDVPLRIACARSGYERITNSGRAGPSGL